METPDFGATIRVPSPGQKVFQRYTLKKILGRGGMGIVWLAHDDKLDRDVALKFLPEVVVHDPKAIDELKREARRNLDLTHPHIVRIYDFVDDAQGAAIAMEYVEGYSLSKLSLTQPGGFFLLHQVRPWVEQLCAALSYAHEEAKVVHRDLKPANLMLDGRERIKITDFGIARSIADSVSRVSAMAGSAGTPMYMSPQQMMGEQPSVTDDVYSLGATLYELLTGKPPFHSGDIIAQVQGKVAPTIGERRRELGFNDRERPDVAVTREWEETIAACLAKERAARPQSAFEVADRLGIHVPSTMGTRGKTAQGGVTTAKIEPPEEKLKAKVGFYSLIAVGILVVAGLGWYFGTQRSEPEFLPSTTPARTTPVEAKRTFTAASSPATTAPLADAHGSMIVKTDPSAAEVTVGALERGVSPLTIKDAKPGRYPVRVRLAGYEDWSGEAVVQANEYTTVEAALVRSAGQVIIRGSPSGAEVSEGNRVLGTLPLALERVPTGDVRYAVRAKGYQTVEVSGTVARNSELKLSATLEKVKLPETGQRWMLSDVNIEMIPIPAGSFALGSTKGDSDEIPVVQVTLSQPYWMGKTEVTQAQWTAVMGGKNPAAFKNPDQPVEQVSWNGALDFCKKLTERERLAGRLPEGYVFTLPTEAQWEYACRAGTTDPYAGPLDTLGWYSGNSGNQAHPVAQKQANPWGLYDTHGSVWEWCLDWYGPYKGGTITDPKGAASGTRRVVRGGSWNSQSSRCRSSVRDGWDPRQSGNNLGFRVSLTVATSP